MLSRPLARQTAPQYSSSPFASQKHVMCAHFLDFKFVIKLPFLFRLQFHRFQPSNSIASIPCQRCRDGHVLMLTLTCFTASTGRFSGNADTELKLLSWMVEIGGIEVEKGT